jgi:DNA-binding winged helix-turn-helix (wHTH) protein
MKPPSDDIGQKLTFGPFRLDRQQRVIFRGHAPLRLGSRAREILLTLVERAGEVVKKSELMARVWPDTVVEEGTLRVHIAALRKALGDGKSGMRYVENVTGRGYRFIAPLTRVDDTRPTPAPQVHAAEHASQRSHRADADDRPCVSGGRTGESLAAAAVRDDCRAGRHRQNHSCHGHRADHLLDSYPHGICFVDLASITDPLLISGTIAAALGLATISQDPLPNVIEFLKHKQMLIVLDSCEHVVEAPERSAGAVDERSSHGRAAASDAAGDARLELRNSSPHRADSPAQACGVRSSIRHAIVLRDDCRR